MLSAGPRQLTFVFADSPPGGKGGDASDVSDGKSYLLLKAEVKEVNDPDARAADDNDRLLERAASVPNLALAKGQQWALAAIMGQFIPAGSSGTVVAWCPPAQLHQPS
ncbi:MAG: hypothetical protein ACYTG0_26775 [Planctomycetota bacterium]